MHASSIEHRASVGLFIGRDLRTSAKQNKALWADWDAFLGTWQGTGNGEPTQGRGEFSFAPELQGAVLVRHNFAEYPASKDRPAYRHDDFMVIYLGADNQKPRADYWDNEGHVIHYEVELSPGKLVFLSDPAQPGPRYRLTYRKTGEDELKLTFEIAPPADRSVFKTYIEASARRNVRK
ncbi:MAG TPA: hypothetical protein VKB48_05550 [Candidatus Acidoferrum sp.]|nr:hypothetical protein [Candidatus Acidoferrum sp.]